MCLHGRSSWVLLVAVPGDRRFGLSVLHGVTGGEAAISMKVANEVGYVPG